MSKTLETREEAAASILTGASAPFTALAEMLGGAAALSDTRGVQTPSSFSDAQQELLALTAGAGVFDQGARVRLRITGGDRVRWLNGMVSNTVKDLAAGAHNYTFILNAQGRIQGDATVFALEDYLLLETDRSQAEHLYAHLDRFIIMDDVELSGVEGRAALGLAGPAASALLAACELTAPQPNRFVAHGAVEVVREHSPGVARYSLWVDTAEVYSLWQRLIAAGAVAAGAAAVEALRVLEGTPLYGIDITNKTLAQETGQEHALSFNKGCYLGQEIVERVRSRATVHRGFCRFALTGDAAHAGAVLLLGDVAIGELTSIAPVTLPGQSAQAALGMVRTDALNRSEELLYPGGLARPLARSSPAPAGIGDH